jgi:glycosidase
MKEPILKLAILVIGIAMLMMACQPKELQVENPLKSSVTPAEWTRNIVLYEVNVRQFSDEGTFAGVTEALPRLKNLGVNVLWFMPIHPIGEINRKGELGSYYSIADYKAVNPEFGTMEDFKSLVDEAHKLGIYVMLDWVGNHSAWDNVIMSENPQWYQKDSLGNFVSPYDWTDVIQFDYTVMPLWDYMVDAMKFWVEEAGVDGYRCDYPGQVPEEFWFRATTELNAIKPVLMLAEDEANSNLLERAFDMNYAWGHHHLMNSVAAGKRAPVALDSMLQRELKYYPEDSYRLRFLDNHDENSWNGTVKERLGDADKVFAAYIFTIPGVPLLYNGQEAGLDKRLKFFERDPIEWKESELTDFYSTLVHLRTSHPALRHGTQGGSFEVIKTNNNKAYVYRRVREDSAVAVILNFSANNTNVVITGSLEAEKYTNVFTGEEFELAKGTNVQLPPWGYLVMKR